MRLTYLKGAILAAAASVALLAPAAQAGSRHHGYHHHGHHYSHQHHYRRVWVQPVYVVRTTCVKYGWVWTHHGHKRWGCVKTW